MYAARPEERLYVVAAESSVPSSEVALAVVRGAREQLAKEGALLGAGEGYPRLEIVVSTSREMSVGAVVPSSARGASVTSEVQKTPVSRGESISVSARGCILRARAGACERDTGTIRREFVASTNSSDPVAATLSYEDEVRRAAARVGEAIAARVLGDPTISEDEAP